MKTNLYGALFLGCLLVISGCAGEGAALKASAGRIGCDPSDVVVSKFEGGLSPARSWTATCKGTPYFCSGMNAGGGFLDVSCTKSTQNK